jgi:hypothetical protein
LNNRRQGVVAGRAQGILVGILSTAVLVYFTLRGVDLGAMMQYVRGAKLPWLFAIGLCTLLADLVRAMRWGSLLQPVRNVPLSTRLQAVLAGSAGNHLLPLRLGEVVRIHRLSARASIPHATTLTTLVVERVFDVIGIMLILGCCMFFFPAARVMDPELAKAINLLWVLCVAIVIASAAILVCRRGVAAWIDCRLQRHSTGRLGRLTAVIGELFAGLGSLRSGRQVASIVALTIVMWLIFGLCFAFGLLSLDLAGESGGALIARSSLVLVFVSIFTMLPAAIGLVGTFQAAAVVALAIFDVPREHALGFSVVVHAVQFVTCSVSGAPFVISTMRRH